MTVLVNGTPIEYERAPVNCRDTIRRYIENRIPMGSFLTAFASNDLFGAIGRADVINRGQFYDIAAFFYNYAPSQCYGSAEKVENWLNNHQSKGN